MRMSLIRVVFFMAVLALFQVAHAKAKIYGSELCQEPGYECYKVMKGDTWAKLYPDEDVREVVKRINRKNNALQPGMIIAIPTGEIGNHMEHSPFPMEMDEYRGQRVILIDLSDLAFGAYNESGALEHWGPISPGKQYCPDTGRRCATPTGIYSIYTKRGAGCKSSKYPVGKGGAPMPYCMFFKGGYALHGSPTVPGHSDSHGCVRLFTEDAGWLNKEFVHGHQVKVIIRQ